MDIKIAQKILDTAGRKRICVLGDVMLDKYMFGNVTRISPEAPVQVFEIKNSDLKLGGAANVSLNVKTLGAEPLLVGVIGKDGEAEILRNAMKNLGQDTSGLVTEEGRPTTCKTRVIADSHHLLRIDSEAKHDIKRESEKKILSILNGHVKDIELIILQDYNKGVLTKPLIRKIIEYSGLNGIDVLVDPKFDNFFEYKNVFLFKPNRKEIEDAFGRKPKTDEELEGIIIELMKRLNCRNVVLTLGEQGMKTFEKKNGKILKSSIGTHARRVADVSGAGDTVISTIAVCLAGGATLRQAVEISNFAAGLVVEEVGIVPVLKKSLLNQIKNR